MHGFLTEPFIFKRLKYKKTGKFLSLKEIMNSDFAFSTVADNFIKNDKKLISNSNSEILNFAKECVNSLNGISLTKEDLEIQNEFDNLYKKIFLSIKNPESIKLGKNKIAISPSFLKSNQDIFK